MVYIYIQLYVFLTFGVVRQESVVHQARVFTSNFFILLLDIFICVDYCRCLLLFHTTTRYIYMIHYCMM